jgi:excisionase family DNA binding protein
MSAPEQRIRKLFHHLHAVADLLEEILLSNPLPRENEKQQAVKNDRRPIEATEKPPPERLAYTLKEVQKLVGISRSAIYLVLAEGELRAVKSGRRTLILAKDLQAWLEKLPAKS